MSDVIVIGGGLTGLAAAWELERQGVPYTLIEVRPRLGGSIRTERADGWTLEAGAFVLEQYREWHSLRHLGMPEDTLIRLARYRHGHTVVFREGTESLISTLAHKLTGSILTRMAVSSVGPLQGSDQLGVCLENGVLMTARAVIVTAPARYAAHMLWTINPEISLLLEDYQYERVARVSLGFRQADAPQITPNIDDWKTRLGIGSELKFLQSYDLPSHVPEGGILLRAGWRFDGDFDAVRAIATVRAMIQPLTAAEPVVARAWFWSEADALTRYLPEHTRTMDAIDALLPPNVALAGSDYRARQFDQRLTQGAAAAEKVLRALT